MFSNVFLILEIDKKCRQHSIYHAKEIIMTLLGKLKLYTNNFERREFLPSFFLSLAAVSSELKDDDMFLHGSLEAVKL